MKYERIIYPDGQISVKIGRTDGMIVERISSYEDLFAIMSAAEAIRFNGLKTKLAIPCLFGQRSDRRFDPWQSFDLKVIAQAINSCDFERVEILDPHSDVACALIERSVAISSLRYVRLVVSDLGNDLVLVSPDAGSYKKVFGYGEELELPVVAAVKHRDLEGGIDLQVIGNVRGARCLIIDDLADGGRTFEVLSKKLLGLGAHQVYLYVTHGYFNKGFDSLESLEHIYCTNSVKDIVHPRVTQFKVV